MMTPPSPPPNTTSGNNSVTLLKHAFENLSTRHTQRQALNPFSISFDANAAAVLEHQTKQRLYHNREHYGRPEPGSLTELRGQQAHSHISKEIHELCQVIQALGSTKNTTTTTTTSTTTTNNEDDDTPTTSKPTTTTFGQLFHWYEHRSNKVVGLLLRARRLGLVAFEGEMLWQRQDEHVVIVLLRRFPSPSIQHPPQKQHE